MLSEEEKEAIEDLNSFKSINILYGNTFTMFLEELKKYQQATDIVLNLITKLQKENEEKDEEIEKKDKQIDLMANYIVDLIKYNNPEEKREVEEIKQYFERKSKK